MAFKPTHVHRKNRFRYIFCVLNCHVFRADDSRTCTTINTYPSYIKLETEINFQNAVTFILVKLDTKLLETTSLPI